MKKTNLLLLIFAAFMITFTSCTKEEISDPEIITEIPIDVDEDMFNPLLDNIENRDDLEEGLELGCFFIDTPFSLDIDGTIIEINTFEDLENAFDFDSSDVAVNVDFVYPLSITYEDGETAELEDGEALGEAFSQCIPDEGWEQQDSTGSEGTFPAYLICEINSCYQLIYPVTLVDIDGIIYTVYNENEFIDVLSTEEFLAFQYPVNLAIEDEDTVVIAASSEELFDLLIDCHDEPWNGGGDVEIDSTFDIGGIACYDLIFPVTFSTLDGGELIINNYEEFSAALLNGNIENFIYPVSLANIDSDELMTVNNDEEFAEALEDCWESDGGDIDPPTGENAIIFFLFSDDFDNDCYSINYPVDVITLDSLQITYYSVEDVINALETSENLPDALVYPVSVINSYGETVTLEGAEDIFDLIEDCK